MADPTPEPNLFDRRDLLAAAAAMGLTLTLPGRSQAAEAAAGPPLDVAMLVYPNMVLLDLVGPMTVLQLAQTRIHLVAKSRAPVITELGIAVTPTATFAECPRDLTVLFAPGGLAGSIPCLGDTELLAFMADRGSRARYVTSVCTGGLILGAAGLLKGYDANTHWYVRDLLPLFGARPKNERVVVDRNRFTAGGVTSGMDFGLTLAAALRDPDFARRIQLTLEYTPKPPFDAGSPELAGEALTRDVLSRRATLLADARKAAEAAGRRL